MDNSTFGMVFGILQLCWNLTTGEEYAQLLPWHLDASMYPGLIRMTKTRGVNMVVSV